MASSESAVSEQPTKPKVDLFKSTYTFDGTEFPAPWPTRVDNQKSPIYALGWLVQAENVWRRRIPKSYSDYRDYVLAPKWAELGYDTSTEENNRDGIPVPDAMIYGDHHLLIHIAYNTFQNVEALRKAEVRKRVVEQAIKVLRLDPELANAGNLWWYKTPAPRKVIQREWRNRSQFPLLCRIEDAELPACVEEMITESYLDDIDSEVEW